MNTFLSTVGRSFVRAFAGSLIVFGAGISEAPSLADTYLVGVAALIAGIVAIIRAVQAYVPQLSVGHYIGQPVGMYVDSFLRASIGALCVTLPGALDAPDMSTGKALVTAAFVGAITMGFRSLQALLQTGASPAPGTGIAEPPKATEQP